MRAAALAICLALVGAASALAMQAGDSPSADPLTTNVGGSFSFANSRDGLPIFTAANIGPGDSARGTVEIANNGSEAIEVTLTKRDLVDTPGTGGGVLSRRLILRVAAAGAPAPAYQGSLAAMPAQPLGRLGPGASRTYELVATLPDDGTSSTAENSVQGAATSIAYSWTAQAAPPLEESPSPTSVASDRGPATESLPEPAAHFSVRVVDYRPTLRNGRLIAWVRCSQACRIKSRAFLRGPRRLGHLRPTARHAQRRRFGAKTRRLSLPVPAARRRLLSTIPRPTVRLVVLADSRNRERATASKLLYLRYPRG